MNRNPRFRAPYLRHLGLLLGFTLSGVCGAQHVAHWVGTWGAAPVPIDNPKPAGDPAGFTLREIVHTSLEGSVIRVALTNEFGTRPLQIGSACVAFSVGGSQAGTAHALSFHGAPSVTIPPGAKILSDPLALLVPFGSNLAVSLYLPAQSIPVLTMHAYANQPNFMATGNQAAAPALQEPVESDSWLFLSSIQVEAPAADATVITLGDSITDGAFSTRGANLRWPDDLARRLHGNRATAGLSVLNEGIGGNRLLHSDIGTNAGPGALARFDRDVLAQPNVKYLLILEGINDIGVGTGPHNPHDTVSPTELIFALSQLIERAHSHGIKVYLATIMPDKGLGLYYTAAGEAEREAVNEWIRSTKLPDGIIDFDKAVRDPADPQRLLPAFDHDHIHPNDAGHQAMADAIDLRDFTR